MRGCNIERNIVSLGNNLWMKRSTQERQRYLWKGPAGVNQELHRFSHDEAMEFIHARDGENLDMTTMCPPGPMEYMAEELKIRAKTELMRTLKLSNADHDVAKYSSRNDRLSQLEPSISSKSRETWAKKKTVIKVIKDLRKVPYVPELVRIHIAYRDL